VAAAARKAIDVVACCGSARRPGAPALDDGLHVRGGEVQRATVEARLLDEVELEGRHDAGDALAAAQREEQVGVLGRGDAPQCAVTGHHLEGAHPVRGQAVRASHGTHSAASRVAHDADAGGGAVERRQPVRRRRLDDAAPGHAGPDPSPALGVHDALVQTGGVDRTCRPRRPAPWPVACGETVSPWARAKRTVCTTSLALARRRRPAGRTGTATFQGVTSAS
jgi:hypothetical protein